MLLCYIDKQNLFLINEINIIMIIITAIILFTK